MRVFQTLLAFSGSAPPQLAVTRELVKRGHKVQVLAARAARARVEATGAEVIEFTGEYADFDMTHSETDMVRDWEARTAMGSSKLMRDRGLIEPLPSLTRQFTAALRDRKADVVVFDWLFVGAAIAAEAASVPAVALVHCPYPLPVSGGPPLFSGAAPMSGLIGKSRDRFLNMIAARMTAVGLPVLNQVRADCGLKPLDKWEDQVLGSTAIYVLTAPELDFLSGLELPLNARYVGPAFEPFARDWRPPWPETNTHPLVLVSFSTSYMNQERMAQRVLDALDGLPLRVFFTVGPALESTHLRLPANTVASAYVPHRSVLPYASLVITHAGWQTVNAALADGVPLVCIPDSRDQPDNAARVVYAGAGVRVSKKSSVAKLRGAIEGALANPDLRSAAQKLAVAQARQDGAAAVALELERLIPPEPHGQAAPPRAVRS